MSVDGYLYFVVCNDDMIIFVGYNIVGLEVEVVFLVYVVVLECVVIGVLDEECGVIVEVYVVVFEGN